MLSQINAAGNKNHKKGIETNWTVKAPIRNWQRNNVMLHVSDWRDSWVVQILTPQNKQLFCDTEQTAVLWHQSKAAGDYKY